MDPKQCLLDAEESIAFNDKASAAELLTNYRDWRAKGAYMPGGIQPRIISDKTVRTGDDFNRILIAFFVLMFECQPY